VNGILAQIPDTKKWNTVELMCGKLVHSNEKSAKGGAPIKGARVRLYLRNEGIECCDSLRPVAETTSSRDGSFKFEKVVPEAYWFVADVEGKDYKLAINYATGNKRDTNCSDILYELKKNELQILRMILVE
jgi:hypothetical protein